MNCRPRLLATLLFLCVAALAVLPAAVAAAMDGESVDATLAAGSAAARTPVLAPSALVLLGVGLIGVAVMRTVYRSGETE